MQRASGCLECLFLLHQFFLYSARKCRQDFVKMWHSSNVCRTEGKVVTVWATRVYGGRGSRRVAALILNLGTRGCGHPHAPAAAFLGTEPRYPLNGRKGEPQRRFDLFGEDKSFLPLAGFENRTVQPVAVTILTDIWQYSLVLLSRCSSMSRAIERSTEFVNSV